MQTSAPLVSVIIPCYNQAHFLSESVESALSQTYPRSETVVVDDGSRDGTAKVMARYSGIVRVRQDNRGLAEARNAGFRASTGDYVLFLDADDRLTPNAVEAHLSCFAKHPEAGFVVGDIDHITLDGSYVGSPRWPVLEANHYEELLKVNHVANTIAVMFRRSVIELTGGFKLSCSPAEDYELLLNAARLFPSAHHQAVVAYYRRHPSSISRKGTVMLRAMHRVMCLQWDVVKNDPRLMQAHRQGDRYWRDYFGRETIREIFAHILRGAPGRALGAVAVLMQYVGGRLFLFPWKYRRALFQAVKRPFRFQTTLLGR